jgi:hypothetical protein
MPANVGIDVGSHHDIAVMLDGTDDVHGEAHANNLAFGPFANACAPQ